MGRHFFVKAILALAAIGLLVTGMRGAFQAGWWQGYQVGQAAESEEGATPYWGPRGTPFGLGHLGPQMYPRMGFRPFGLLRPLFTFVLLLFLFSLAAKAFGFWAWRHAGGKDWRKVWPHGHPLHGHPHHGRPPHGHWPHGPMPPWCWAAPEAGETESDEAEPAEEQVAKVKPDAGATEG